MKTPTFREQYDKIVGAYMRNELRPFDSCACFVGNLLNRNHDWAKGRTFESKDLDSPTFAVLGNPCYDDGIQVFECQLRIEANSLYTPQEIIDLENLFLHTISEWWQEMNCEDEVVPEDRLFKAMEVTLKALRELHESKGEVIEDYVFQKRELVKA